MPVLVTIIQQHLIQKQDMRTCAEILGSILTALHRRTAVSISHPLGMPHVNVYSCFEKGCLTNGEKLTRLCRKLLWVLVVFTVAWVNLKVFQRSGRKQHKHIFVLSRSLLLNHLELQSSKAKLLLPIMPIGIVEYAFALSGDNLCRNSCIIFGI